MGHAIGRADVDPHRWAAWANEQPALAGLRDTAGLLDELRAGTPQRRDELLGALVRLAQRAGPHSDAALLVLARCLWPGVRHRVTVYGSPLETDEATSIVLVALVESIKHYDIAARPAHVANRLLAVPTRRLRRAAAQARDTAHRGSPVTDDGCDVTIVAGGGAASPGIPELSGVGLLRVAVDAGVLRPADAWLIWATRLGGVPLAAAADRLGVRYPAAWQRRRRAERRWAAWWAPDHPAHHNGRDQA